MTKKIDTAKEVDVHLEYMDKLFDSLNEIKSAIEAEKIKIEKTIIKIKSAPKPDVELITMPERMRCYRDGLKYSLDIIKKFIQIESVSKYGDLGKD